ncbi:MAG: PIN domain-containing protein [Verrucomicrobiota bacterium]|nr:PIN domain-containing protein [Verrucomicrobiota bacterium]
MPVYFDSSVLLEVLFRQPRAGQCIKIWSAERDRHSSLLLVAECVINIRKAGFSGAAKVRDAFVSERLATLEKLAKAMSLRQIDDEVIEILQTRPELARCRTLDALHVASALLLQEHLDEPLEICSLDKRQREMAQAVGLKVSP